MKPLDPLRVHINLHWQRMPNEVTIYVLDIGCREARQSLMLMYLPNLMKNLCWRKSFHCHLHWRRTHRVLFPKPKKIQMKVLCDYIVPTLERQHTSSSDVFKKKIQQIKRLRKTGHLRNIIILGGAKSEKSMISTIYSYIVCCILHSSCDWYSSCDLRHWKC